ncbi:MAG: biotin synthase BioB [Candidatus Sumerlaeia bacterium]|nr:biotin synthase BioB [Candidatus Sumerlaeia bacterium]
MSTTAALPQITRDEVRAIFTQPFPDLLIQAALVHREHHDPLAVQFCTLENIKSGRCPEDCKYCPQSAHNDTGIEEYGLESLEEVLAAADAAKANGSTRVCLGAAWRGPRNEAEFERVLDMVRGIRARGMEACVTLGLLTQDQARRLAEAGLTAYNHNIDTSPEYYGKIITTRTFEDRLRTISYVREAGVQVCTGGIIGMGESREDRVGMLHALASLDPHPESVPINMLVRVPGTPLEHVDEIDPLELIRCIATARILMPESRVRLSAGRMEMSRELQAMAFFAGANSIFTGEKLLTTPNPGAGDRALLAALGMHEERAGGQHHHDAHGHHHHDHDHHDHEHGHGHHHGAGGCSGGGGCCNGGGGCGGGRHRNGH